MERHKVEALGYCHGKSESGALAGCATSYNAPGETSRATRGRRHWINKKGCIRSRLHQHLGHPVCVCVFAFFSGREYGSTNLGVQSTHVWKIQKCMYTVCISSTLPKTNMKPKKGPLKKEKHLQTANCVGSMLVGGCICMSSLCHPSLSRKNEWFLLEEAIQVHPKDQMNRFSLRLASTKTSNEK